MTDIIKMDYRHMEEMAQAFAQGAQTLEASIAEVRQIAEMLENGGLRGEAGDAFSAACRHVLNPAVQRLHDKFLELQGGVLGALDDMRGVD